MKARFHELASLELEEAIDYYDEKSEGLGDRFLSEIQAATEFIERNPRASEVIGRQVRRKVLVKFPYDLFYVVEGEEIIILAVANESRRPGYWKSRGPGRGA